MTQTGDITCAEKLLRPARRILKTGRHIRLEPFEHRLSLWNNIKSNYDRYLQEDCGIFLEEVDLHVRAQFDASLTALASAFIENREEFSQAVSYSPKEIEIWERIEEYNVMEILSKEDLLHEIIKKDANLLALLQRYYLTMKEYVRITLEDSTIRLTLRYYLKRRWGSYQGKMDSAIAEAVNTLDWMGELLREWERMRDEEMSTHGSDE